MNISPGLIRSWPDYLLATSCAITAWLLFRAGHAVRMAHEKGQTRDTPVVWWSLGMLFVLFACVKAANGLSLLGGLMRQAAHAEGIYPERRAIQYVVLGLLGMGAFVGIASLATHRGTARRHRAMLACTGAVAIFAAARFVSLHAVDAWMNHAPWLRPLAEIFLIATIGTIAWRTRKSMLRRSGGAALSESSRAKRGREVYP